MIEQARQAGDGEFRVASYEAIATGELDVKVDFAIANVSLIGKRSVENLLVRVPALLNSKGAPVVQTLHPPTGELDASTGNAKTVDSQRALDRWMARPRPIDELS